jgi:hypothetical protein
MQLHYFIVTQKKGAIMNRMGFVVLFAVSGVFAFSDSNDTGSVAKIITRMQGRIDSMETELHKLKIEKSDNSPGATGEIRNWGKGVFGGMHLDFNVTDIEIGYMFTRKHCRLGAATGIILNDIIGRRQWSDIDRPASWYGSFLLGTPVFLNFMSLTGFAKVSMLIKNDGGKINNFSSNGMYLAAQGYGFSLGGDIDFWLTKHWNLLLGPEMDLIVNSKTRTGSLFFSGTRFGLKYFL